VLRVLQYPDKKIKKLKALGREKYLPAEKNTRQRRKILLSTLSPSLSK
jgi:hypothetical protein